MRHLLPLSALLVACGGAPKPVVQPAEKPMERPKPEPAAKAPAESKTDSAGKSSVLNELSASEMDARKRALENAKIRDAEERVVAERLASRVDV